MSDEKREIEDLKANLREMGEMLQEVLRAYLIGGRYARENAVMQAEETLHRMGFEVPTS